MVESSYGTAPEDYLSFFTELGRSREALIPYRLPSIPRGYLVNQPRLVQEILVDRHAQFHHPRNPYQDLAGVLTHSGRYSLRMSPATHDVRERLRHATARAARELCEGWERALSSRGELDILPSLEEAMVCLLGRLLYGLELGPRARAFLDATDCIERGAGPRDKSEAFTRELRAAKETLTELADQLLRERAAQRAIAPEALCRLDGAPTEWDTLVDGVIRTLFMGGPPLAATLAFTLHLLATHPEVAARLHDEIERRPLSRSSSVVPLAGREWTRMSVQEALRLYPPVWMVHRKSKDDGMVGDTLVPKMALLTLCPYTMHRSPDHWDDPDAFRPLRFHPEPVRQRPAGLYVPFAMGPHRCAAAHVALPIIEQMVMNIMARFRMEPAPDFTPRPVGLIALRPGGGMRLILVSRA